MSESSDDAHVLGELLICLFTGEKMLSFHSDFEMCQGYQLFEQLYKVDPKCHEALFGLARISCIQGRFEAAEKLLMQAYESKRDFVYRVWLGYT
jgi:tetratricopeptide (TPR) repeat protein